MLQERLLLSLLPAHIARVMKAEIIQRLQGPKFGQVENTNNFHNLYVQRHTNVRCVTPYHKMRFLTTVTIMNHNEVQHYELGATYIICRLALSTDKYICNVLIKETYTINIVQIAISNETNVLKLITVCMFGQSLKLMGRCCSYSKLMQI